MASTEQNLNELLEIAHNGAYGIARAMIVGSLWRYRRDERIRPTLQELAAEPNVALAAMSALRRVVGNEDALLLLRRLRDSHADPRVRERAARQVKRAERAAAKTARGTGPDEPYVAAVATRLLQVCYSAGPPSPPRA